MRLTTLLIALLLVANIAVAEQPKIRFFCGLDVHGDLFHAYTQLYQQAFKSLGYDFEMLQRPLARVYADLTRGAADGDCARVKRLSEITGTQQFVRVDALVADASVDILSYNDSIQYVADDDLRSGAYRIGILRGDMAIADKLQSMGVEVEKLGSAVMGIKMLYGGRLDLFLVVAPRVDAAMETIPDIPPPNKVGEAMRLKVYPYLSLKHANLASPLAEEIRKILEDRNHPVHQFSGLLK